MTTRRRRRWQRTLGAVLLAGLLGTVATACSSGGGAPSVASLPGHGRSSNAASATVMPTEAQFDRDAVDYARCLRAHGVNEPDPAPRAGHSGLSFAIPPSTPANHAALAACNHFVAKVFSAKQAGANQELTRWLPSLVRYAACMRNHDIPMLDPGPQGQLNLGNVPGITSDFGRYSPQFRSADAACRHLLPGGVHDDGTGP
jgi:hypothetical protein